MRQQRDQLGRVHRTSAAETDRGAGTARRRSGCHHAGFGRIGQRVAEHRGLDTGGRQASHSTLQQAGLDQRSIGHHEGEVLATTGERRRRRSVWGIPAWIAQRYIDVLLPRNLGFVKGCFVAGKRFAGERPSKDDRALATALRVEFAIRLFSLLEGPAIRVVLVQIHAVIGDETRAIGLAHDRKGV